MNGSYQVTPADNWIPLSAVIEEVLKAIFNISIILSQDKRGSSGLFNMDATKPRDISQAENPLVYKFSK